MKKILALLGALVLITPAFAQLPGLEEIERLGFADILLWLLTFAVVYGVLTQVKIPASNAARAIISIVAGFLVLLAVPAQLITVLSNMSSNLILIVLGILALIVFLEVAGVKTKGKVVGQHKETGEYAYEHKDPISYLTYHKNVTAAVIIIIAALVFIGSGGLGLLGLSSIPQFDLTGLFFFIVIIMAVIWMIAESGKK